MRTVEEKARELHDRGRAAVTAGRSAAGIRHFTAALRLLGRPGTGERDRQAIVARILISAAAAEVHLGRRETGFRLLDDAEPLVAQEDRVTLLSQRGLLCILTGRLDEALTYLDEAVPLYRRPQDDYHLAADLLNRAMLHSLAGKARLGRADLVRCEEIARAANLPVVVAKAQLNRGYCEMLMGDVPAALRTFDLARPVFEEHAPDVLPVLAIDRARTLMQAGLAGEAATELDEAIRLLGHARPTYERAEAALARAQAAVVQQDVITARKWARRAERCFQRRGDEGWAAVAVLTRLRADLRSGRGHARIAEGAASLAPRLLGLGLRTDAESARLLAARAHVRCGQTDAARRHLAGPRSAFPVLETRLLRSLAAAELHAAEGDVPATLRHARKGLATLSEHRGRLGSLDLRTGTSALGVDLAAVGLGTAVRHRGAPVVFDWAERSRAQAFLMGPVRPAADQETSDAVAELRQLAVVARAAELAGRPDRDARNRCAELEHQIRARGWQADGAGEQTHVVSFRDVAAELCRTGEVMVSFLTAADVLHAVVVSGGTGRLVRFGDLATITEAVARLRTDLDAACGRRLPAAVLDVVHGSIRHQLAVLRDEVLTPLRDLLRDHELVLVPTGPLAAVPWGLFDELRGRPVTVAPSASLWWRGRRLARPGNLVAEPLLVAGPDLDFAADEVSKIAGLLPGSTVLTGQEATVEATLAAMSHRRIVHLAAHGHHEPGNHLFSRLDLVDGPLMAFDVAGLDRAPEHVVLSSCDTGRSVVRAGDEMLGFTAAFLYGGTRTVVAGVARVPDDPVVDVMAAYHDLLCRGAAPPRALAEALAMSPLIPLVCFGSS
ncbi:CHAT domain-containing protein [Lentzea sp. NPDC058450]|uniref:CHAT domain-containing protein n=1 Tax=Lentzea sp. NPDC058450 TaxID=3346505 RepID=UPI0036621346